MYTTAPPPLPQRPSCHRSLPRGQRSCRRCSSKFFSLLRNLHQSTSITVMSVPPSRSATVRCCPPEDCHHLAPENSIVTNCSSSSAFAHCLGQMEFIGEDEEMKEELEELGIKNDVILLHGIEGRGGRGRWSRKLSRI
ncbi:cyclin-F [Sesbania bispinosa]|nr:cyclin-F [Sesbania bispinosa]